MMSFSTSELKGLKVDQLKELLRQRWPDAKVSYKKDELIAFLSGQAEPERKGARGRPTSKVTTPNVGLLVGDDRANALEYFKNQLIPSATDQIVDATEGFGAQPTTVPVQIYGILPGGDINIRTLNATTGIPTGTTVQLSLDPASGKLNPDGKSYNFNWIGRPASSMTVLTISIEEVRNKANAYYRSVGMQIPVAGPPDFSSMKIQTPRARIASSRTGAAPIGGSSGMVAPPAGLPATGAIGILNSSDVPQIYSAVNQFTTALSNYLTNPLNPAGLFGSIPQLQRVLDYLSKYSAALRT
jgi:hypothetical protein